MKGTDVDGMDVVAVFEATKEAVNRARSGQGPTLIECKTYRYRGHHEGDPNMGARYRTKEEIEAWKKKDPIDRMTELLLTRKAVTRSQLSEMNRDVMARVKGAVEFALESPSPEPQELYEDVYV
jgi:pyruvate dehydrogenase E1 component alpha subunit